MNDLELNVRNKIIVLRNLMQRMDTDFDGMQMLQAQIEILKEVSGDTSEDIECDWFDAYGMELERRVRKSK